LADFSKWVSANLWQVRRASAGFRSAEGSIESL